MAYQQSSFDRGFQLEERTKVLGRGTLVAREDTERRSVGAPISHAGVHTAAEFTIGGVLHEAGRFARSHGGALLTAAVSLVGAPAALGAGVMQWAAAHGSLSLAWLPGTLSSIGGVLLSVVVTQMMADSWAGRAPGVRTTIGAAGALFFPVLGVTIVSMLGAAAGSLLLVIPGLILLCRWAVAVQVLVVERAGVFASLRRSAELTRGCRWRIFGLLLLTILISGVIEIALGAGGGGAVALFGASSARISILALAQAIAGMAAGLISDVVYGSIYLTLRRSREGSLSQAIVSVFD